MIEFILRLSAILLTIQIALTPWLYPKYSLYTRRAASGIETLRTPRITEDSIEAGYIENGEKGFRQVKKAATQVYGFLGDVDRICFAWGSPPSIADFAGLDETLGGFGDNGLVYAKTPDGETIRLRYRPGGPQQTRRLVELHAGVAMIAHQRAQKLTGGLVVCWGTVALLILGL